MKKFKSIQQVAEQIGRIGKCFENLPHPKRTVYCGLSLMEVCNHRNRLMSIADSIANIYISRMERFSRNWDTPVPISVYASVL